MFRIDEDNTIHVTRGDAAAFDVKALFEGEDYTFEPGDVVRLNVYGKKNTANVVLTKDFKVKEETQSVEVWLEKSETKFEKLINKPKDYWYEVVLNPDTKPQTILGYDEDGAKLFKLYPEGGDEE